MQRTHEHQEIYRTVERFVVDEINPHVEQWERDGVFPAHEIFKKMGDLGILGIHKPEAVGGMGLDYSYQMEFAEALGACTCGGIPMAIGVQTDMATPALARFGSDYLKDNFLKPAIAGDHVAAIAVSEPGAGSDSAAIRTTAELDGDHYVLNGEKIYVTSGERADLGVVWASLDRSKGRAAIKSFVVEKGSPGFELVRLEHKLGIRASDTAAFILNNVRVPKENLLGSPEVDVSKGFAGVMQTFDNTRPLVAGMAVGLARACLDETRAQLISAGMVIDYDAPAANQPATVWQFLQLEADYEAARLLTLEAAWMADNRQPNSLQASMAKAKAGRSCVDIALQCVAICGALGYTEHGLLEKWARDAKILDIFEGTQQIQQLIVARRLLGKSSSELK